MGLISNIVIVIFILYLILNKIHTNTKTVLACTAVMVAFALIVAPLAMSQDASAGNKAKQSIKQQQSNHQSSQSIGGGGNFLSGNNVNFQNQQNFGSNNLGQSSD